jgi:hypothetical protein
MKAEAPQGCFLRGVNKVHFGALVLGKEAPDVVDFKKGRQ